MKHPSSSAAVAPDILFAARALGCHRGLRDVFAGVEFALSAGDALILTGPNGSGKSSLLRVLAGLTPASSGDVLWQGARVGDDREAHRARLAYLGHADAVKPALSAAENLDFWISLGVDREQGDRCAAALAQFGLDELGALPSRFLSAGQRRRLALARVVAVPRALWLLDEPSVGLDDKSVAALLQAIAAHRQDGGIAVISTHAPLPLDGARGLDLALYAAAA